jgi:hypothetical protein
MTKISVLIDTSAVQAGFLSLAFCGTTEVVPFPVSFLGLLRVGMAMAFERDFLPLQAFAGEGARATFSG